MYIIKFIMFSLNYIIVSYDLILYDIFLDYLKYYILHTIYYYIIHYILHIIYYILFHIINIVY